MAPPRLEHLRFIELQRVTEDNGFGDHLGEENGWHAFKGLAVDQTLWVAYEQPLWHLGIAHQGVMQELLAELPPSPHIRPDGGQAVVTERLYEAVYRIFRLARSLPTAPLDRFAAKKRALPAATEAERHVIERIGQDIFREALLEYWHQRCPLTAIRHPRLLRASHMKPWKDCASDAERLDVHNGLLLAAHLDAAFDAGLVTFTEEGHLLTAPILPKEDRAALALDTLPPLKNLRPAHRPYLQWHRERVFTG